MSLFDLVHFDLIAVFLCKKKKKVYVHAYQKAAVPTQMHMFDSLIKHVSKYLHSDLIWITALSASHRAVDIVELTCSHPRHLKLALLHARRVEGI